jgi:hypothetical protein
MLNCDHEGSIWIRKMNNNKTKQRAGILFAEVLEQVADGPAWETITEEWGQYFPRSNRYTKHPYHRSNRIYQRGVTMITDTEIKRKGLQILTQYLGNVEAERFVALIQREPFDYTKWRQEQEMDENLSLEEISRRAMLLSKKSIEQNS